MPDETPLNVRIEYHNDATINTGNFQNLRPGYTVSADVPEGVHPGVIRAKLKGLVDSWLEQDIEKIRAEL